MAIDPTPVPGTGSEPTQTEGQPSQSDTGGQPGGGSPGQPGSAADGYKGPLTQEAFNTIYREKKELREAAERDKETAMAYFADLERRLNERPAASPPPAAPVGEDSLLAKLPAQLRRAIEANPELNGSVELIKAVAEAILTPDRETIRNLRAELDGNRTREQTAAYESQLSAQFESMADPILKEFGLNPNSSPWDETMALFAGTKTNEGTPAHMLKLPLSHPVRQDWWVKNFRANLSSLLKQDSERFETRHQAKLADLQKNKKAVPAGGPAPTGPAPDSFEAQVAKLLKEGKWDEALALTTEKIEGGS